MAQNALTVQQVALLGLQYFGVVSLNPASPSPQAQPIQPNDLPMVLRCLNGAFQQYFKDGPSEVRESNVGANINAPTTVTLTATNGSTAISGLTTYASWMLGCTIVITGDTQDNELTSSTLLARPFQGTTGTGISATVYNDSIQLDWTVSEVLNPVFIASPSMTFLRPCKTRMEFARIAGVPLVTTPDGWAYDWPFFWIVQKAVSRPLWWYLEAAYSSPLGYVPRRIRLAPMPGMQLSMGFRITSTATRYLVADVMNNDFSDPGTLLPINDGDVEELLMPIFIKKLSECPQFKNASQMPSIMAAYAEAKDNIANIHAQADAPIYGGYP